MAILFQAARPVYGEVAQSVSISGNNNVVIQNIIELSMGDPDWLEKNQTVVENLASRLGLTEALIVNFLRTVDLSSVPREEWANVLRQHAANFVELKRQAAALAATDLANKQLILSASNAAQDARWSDADTFLAEAEDQLAKSQNQTLLNFAELRSLRARVLIAQQSLAAAGEVFLEAAVFAGPADKAKARTYLALAADAYLREGNERLQPSGFERAIFIVRTLLLPKIERPKDESEWRTATTSMAVAIEGLGNFSGDEEKLREALSILQSLLTEGIRGSDPVEWAGTHRHIGNVLQALGALTGKSEAYAAALRHYNAALGALDPIRDADDWGANKNNIGYVLYIRSFSDPDVKISDEALTALQQSLELTPRDRSSSAWAMTQTNIAAVLMVRGFSQGRESDFVHARNLLDQVLGVCTKNALPRCWSRAKRTLGDLNYRQGMKNGDARLFEDAIRLYRESLTELDAKDTPVEWGGVLKDLGIVQRRLGQQLNDDGLQRAAVEDLQRSLAVWSAPRFKTRWVDAKQQIADIQRSRGRSPYRPELLVEAASAYGEIVDATDRNVAPRTWAANQASLGGTLAYIGREQNDLLSLNAALEHLRLAMEVYQPGKDAQMWAWIQETIGAVLWSRSNLKANLADLVQAREAYITAIDAYSPGNPRRADIQILLSQLQQQIGSTMTQWFKQ